MADPHSSAPSADADAYVRGSQQIQEQVSTFHLFQGLAKWGSLATAVVLAMLTIWFMPGGGFVPAAGVAIVMAVAGFFFLRSGKSKH